MGAGGAKATSGFKWVSQRTRGGREGGQATVELALVFPLVFALIMGCLELGVAFNGYVSVVTAARAGAQAGAIYLYDSSLSSTVNDQNRATAIRNGVASSLGVLRNTPPYFDRNSSDVTISYIHDPSLPALDTRKGDLVRVQVAYRYELLSKLLRDSPIVTMRAQAQARIE